MIPVPCLTFSFAGISIPWLCTQVDMFDGQSVREDMWSAGEVADAQFTARWRTQAIIPAPGVMAGAS